MLKKILFIVTLLINLGLAGLDNPYKLTANESGDYFVADTLHNSVKRYNSEGTVFEFPYNFNQPQAVAVYNNVLYVLDTGSNKLLKFLNKPEGVVFATEINIPLNYPRDLDFSPDGKYLYILDSGNNSVVRLKIENNQESLEFRFGELTNAYGIAADPWGNIFIADTGKHRILKYTADGKLLRSFGREGNKKGEFLYPKDLVVGYSGFMIVADSGNNRIQRLSDEGHYLNEIPLEGPLTDIRGLALNKKNGQLYITDSGANHVLQKNLGYKIKNFSVENEVFSPNNDQVRDQAYFKCELSEPANIGFEIYKNGSLYERNEGLKNVSGIQKIAWQPLNKNDNGNYDFIFYCSDTSAGKEPYVIKGSLTADLTNPQLLDFFVSPNTLSPNPERNFEKFNFKALYNEPAKLNIILSEKDNENLFSELSSDSYTPQQTLAWNGENKYKEIKNGTYKYIAWGIDEAGNKSEQRQGEIKINYDHPLIALAGLSNQMVKLNSSVILNYLLSAQAQIKIQLKKIDGTAVKTIFSGEQEAGKYKREISLDGIASNEYTLLIEAINSKTTDKYYNRLIIDGLPPELNDLTISKKEIWSGGLDKTNISFICSEKSFIKIFLKDQKSKITAILKDKEVVYPNNVYQFNFNGLDINDKYIPAGDYIIYIEATDEIGNTKIKTLDLKIISSTPQLLDFRLTSDILSPSGYGSYHFIEFKYNLQESSGDLYVTLKIYKNGKLIETIADRQRRLRGYNFDYWYSRSDLEDGIYQYDLLVRDDFGHYAQKQGDLYVINQNPLLKGFNQSETAISPANNDGVKDNTIFTFSSIISNTLILKSMSLEDNTTTNITPRKIKIKINIGENNFELFEEAGNHQYIWNGKDKDGNYVKDDTYDYEIYAIDATGAESAKITGSIVVANSREKITYYNLQINGENNSRQTFNPYTGSSTITLNYGLGFFPTNQTMKAYIYSENGNLIKSLPTQAYNGSGNYTFIWNGKTNNNYWVNDGNYYFLINIQDAAGNNFNYTPTINGVPSFNYNDNILVVTENIKTYLFSLTNNSGQPRIYYQRGVKEPKFQRSEGDESSCDSGSHHEYSYPLSNMPYGQNVLIEIDRWGYYQSGGTYLRINSGAAEKNTFEQFFPANFGGEFDLRVESTGGPAHINYSLKYYYYQYTKYSLDSVNFKVWGNRLGPITQESNWSYPQATTLNCYGNIHEVWTDGNTLYYRRGNGTHYTQDIILANNYILDPVLATFNNEVYVLWGNTQPNNGNIYIQKIPEYFLPVSESGFTITGLNQLFVNKITLENFALTSISNPILISPINNETISESRPIFIWQSPTWAVMTSTNYILNISPDNDNFNQADDTVLNLSPAQLSFSGTSSNILSYKLPQTYALSGGIYYWQILVKDSPALPVKSTSNIASFQLKESLEIDKQINYPNPFADKTTIRYKLSQDADVTIKIFNIAGQLVKNMDFSSGFEGGKAATYFDPYNDIEWDGTNDFSDEVVNDPYVFEITAEKDRKTVKARGRMLKWK